MGFTINQVRHFYVAKKVEAPVTADHAKNHLDDTAAVGTLLPHVNKEKDHIYFEYAGPGDTNRSDLIRLSKISYVKITKKEDLRNPIKSWEVEFPGAPAVVDSEVMLVVKFKQFLSMSEEDTQSVVINHVPKKAGDTVSDVLKHLAFQLAKSLFKSFNGMLKISLDGTAITKKTKLEDLTGTYTKIEIEELEQPWSRGLRHVRGIDFDVRTIVSEDAGFEFVAKKLKEDRATKGFPNGKKIADMEWFYHGARGDYYRNVNYPYVIETEYVADPTKEYYTLDIHYAHADEGISTYHSEKDITIAAEDKDALVAIAQAIKTEAESKGVEINLYGDEC